MGPNQEKYFDETNVDLKFENVSEQQSDFSNSTSSMNLPDPYPRFIFSDDYSVRQRITRNKTRQIQQERLDKLRPRPPPAQQEEATVSQDSQNPEASTSSSGGGGDDGSQLPFADIEAILGGRRRRVVSEEGGRRYSQQEYLIRWKGFSYEHDEWVAWYNIDAMDLIREFNVNQRQIKKKQKVKLEKL